MLEKTYACSVEDAARAVSEWKGRAVFFYWDGDGKLTVKFSEDAFYFEPRSEWV